MDGSDPDELHIDVIHLPGGGRIALSRCPGLGMKTLGEDLDRIRAAGPTTLVCLLPPDEMARKGVDGLIGEAERRGIDVIHIPTRDMTPPGAAFDAALPAIMAALDRGERVHVHCRMGLGRAGSAAAAILVARGMSPSDALKTVRAARPGTIETDGQEAWLAARVR